MTPPKITYDDWAELLNRESMIRDPRADGWAPLAELVPKTGLSRPGAASKLNAMAAAGRLESRRLFDPQTRRWCRFYRPPAKPKV